MKDALLILSGGMDSVTALYVYAHRIGLCVTYNYGSKHNQNEIEFAKYHCEKLGISHIVIDIKSIFDNIASDLLLSGGEIPDGHYEDQSMRRTVVPFRNGILLSIATGIAESNNLNTVMIGSHSGDHAIYPDCRPTFNKAISDAMFHGTYIGVILSAPFDLMNKRDIALAGKNYGVDFSKTWTCYKGRDIHCGVCGSCTERKEALLGFDNTEYEQ